MQVEGRLPHTQALVHLGHGDLGVLDEGASLLYVLGQQRRRSPAFAAPGTCRIKSRLGTLELGVMRCIA